MQRFIFFFFVTASLFAQSVLTVHVNEHYTRAPLAGVQVTLEQQGNTTTALTDSTGTAQLTFTPTGIESAPIFTERPQKIELYNILGQRVFSLRSAQELKNSLSTLASGVYILRAFYRQQVVQAKSVVLNGRALNASWNGILQRSLSGSQTSLKKAVASAGSATDGDLHLSLSREGCTSFDTTFAAPTQDTTVQVFLHQINSVKIRSFDVKGHELHLPFAVRGLSYSLEATGDSLELYSGRYLLQAQNPDTLQALIDTVEIVSDSTLAYVLPAVQKYLIKLTFHDTDGSPINGLQVELWKNADLRYAFVTDSSGLVQDSVYSALYVLKTHKDNVKPLETELNVTGNLEKDYVTDEKDSVMIPLTYPDGAPASNKTIAIGDVKGTTDTTGLFVVLLYDGNYNMTISGSDIENLSKLISVAGKLSLEEVVREKIQFSNPHVSFNEGDSTLKNVYDYVQCENGFKSANFESLDSMLVIEKGVFKGLHVNTSGDFNYRIRAIAKHGTEKSSSSFTAHIENMRTFEGHIYELLAIYDGKDTVSFPGAIEIYYNPETADTFYTDENGHFHFTLPEGTNIAYLKYYTLDKDGKINSFIVTYSYANVPINKQEDWVNIGLMVTRFENVITGYGAPPEYSVKIVTFREYAQSSNFFYYSISIEGFCF